MLRKKFGLVFKELLNFLPKNLSAASVRHRHCGIRVESGTAGHGLVQHCPTMPICSFIAVLWFRGILVLIRIRIAELWIRILLLLLVAFKKIRFFQVFLLIALEGKFTSDFKDKKS
jgi:hypothetical protein